MVEYFGKMTFIHFSSLLSTLGAEKQKVDAVQHPQEDKPKVAKEAPVTLSEAEYNLLDGRAKAVEKASHGKESKVEALGE